MATKLTKPVTRETGVHYRDKPIMVMLDGAVIRMWEKGRRHKYTIDIASVFQFAYSKEAERLRPQRQSTIRGNRV